MKIKLGLIKLRIISGKATPSPPIGPALGQKGLNIIEFCRDFNHQTSSIFPPILLPVLIKFYSDKTYNFLIKKPSISTLIKNLLKTEKFSNKPGKENKYSLNLNNIKDILKYKFGDFNSINIQSCFKIILGSIKSMGIKYN